MGQLSMDLYLKELRKRYIGASKTDKSIILDDFCSTFGYHRKHAIRLLGKPTNKRSKKKTGRKKVYEASTLLEPLKMIWLKSNQPCGKRLKELLPLWLPSYCESFEALSDDVLHNLYSMSSSTIDRLLSPLRVKYRPKYGGTKPGKILKSHIPVKTCQWNTQEPGFVEADTVAHCGGSLSGSFIWSLTVTDIYSGWTENRAVWNKGAQGVVEQINDIENTLPFELKGFDCDNGSEFLNWHLMRYFSLDNNEPRIQFTRSRPYHKDDNAHVEQKNWTHVRQLFGYDRFDNPKLVEMINDVYKNEVSLLTNFFLPNFKLIDKTRVKAKVIKKHDKPKTPFQRLIACNALNQQKQSELQSLYESLNPFELKKSIDAKLNNIFSIVGCKVLSKNNAN